MIESHVFLGIRYAGQLYAWDVVNEPFNEDGENVFILFCPWPGAHLRPLRMYDFLPGTYRSSVFYDTIGPQFIPIALRAARRADPTAKLYLNDYNTDWVGAKSNAMYTLAQSLIAQGVPLDGIGFRTYPMSTTHTYV